jgi:hypothetical protein
MFHGNKKKEKKQLTEEELKKIDEKIEKIKMIQSGLLEKRQARDYKEENLGFLLKAAVLLTDFSTIWTYRKEIILHLKSEKSQDDFYKLLVGEIKQISQLMMKNPKSYVLWYHRIWCLGLSSEIERETGKSLAESLLIQEIQLCNMFFEKDDRNFHCWNYRLMIFKTIYQYFEANFWDFLNKELVFTITMISKNFSNFSAWHYRSKLISLHFDKNGIDWNSSVALDFFKKDLEFITNAINTDPKDQSPWNYHSWIVNNLIPIYIRRVEVKDGSTVVEFSDIVMFNEIARVVDRNTGEEIIGLNIDDKYTNTLIIPRTDIKIENRMQSEPRLISENNISFSNTACFSKNNLFFSTLIVNADGTYKLNEKLCDHQIGFIKSQIEVIDNLIKSSESFLEYAHFRKAQLLNLLSVFNAGEEYLLFTKSEYMILKDNSKRMKTIYESILNKL